MKANKKDICWHISSNKIMTEKRAGLVLNCVGTHQHTEKAKPLRSKSTLKPPMLPNLLPEPEEVKHYPQ